MHSKIYKVELLKISWAIIKMFTMFKMTKLKRNSGSKKGRKLSVKLFYTLFKPLIKFSFIFGQSTYILACLPFAKIAYKINYRAYTKFTKWALKLILSHNRSEVMALKANLPIAENLWYWIGLKWLWDFWMI